MKEQLYIILQKLVTANNIRVHKQELQLQLVSHPSYPSLHSVTGVLDHFGIPNLAVKLPVNNDILKELPSSFLANIKSDASDELVLVTKTKSKLKITTGESNSYKMQPEAFIKIWDGVIIAIEKDDTVQEKNSDYSTIKNLAAAVLGLLVVAWFFSMTNSLFGVTHFGLSLIGLAVSILIVRHELGINSKFTENICSSGSKTNCDSVLNSNGAQIFGGIKLSDLSLVAFGSFILNWLLIALTQVENTSLVLVTTLSAVPVIVYSIYYQGLVVKQWCPLCLAIAAILLLQLGTLFIDSTILASINLDKGSLLIFGVSLLITMLVWAALKGLLANNTSYKTLKIKSYKFKRNFNLFKTLLIGELQVNQNSIRSEIVLGNPNAVIQLILLTSPFCFYCKDTHQELTKVLALAGDKIGLRVRFKVDKNKQYDHYSIASELLHIYHTQGQKAILNELHKLYSPNADPLDWAKQKIIHFNPAYNKVLELQKNWATANKVNFTPALFVNGSQFPKEYNKTDLALFLDDLTEQLQAKNTAA